MADSVVIDYKQGTSYDLSPFFAAGSAHAADWIHRNEGEKTVASGLVSDAKQIDNKSDTGKRQAVISAQISGIAGYTKYQGQVTMVVVPNGKG